MITKAIIWAVDSERERERICKSININNYKIFYQFLLYAINIQLDIWWADNCKIIMCSKIDKQNFLSLVIDEIVYISYMFLYLLCYSSFFFPYHPIFFNIMDKLCAFMNTICYKIMRVELWTWWYLITYLSKEIKKASLWNLSRLGFDNQLRNGRISLNPPEVQSNVI